MKKILFIVLCVAGITMYSCTKEELVIIDEELVLEENSPEFQTYLAERAMGFIRMYRFEKLGNVLDKIEDTALKTNLLDSLRKYKTEAVNGGLFFVTPQNDSLFFMVPHAQSPAERTSLGMLFNTSPNIINAKGVLQGFKNFPKVQYFSGTNSLATGLKDLEYMPDRMDILPGGFYPVVPRRWTACHACSRFLGEPDGSNLLTCRQHHSERPGLVVSICVHGSPLKQ